MLEELPNFMLMIGYTNASWTLGADVSALLHCRIMKGCIKKGASSVAPRLTEKERKTLGKKRLLNLHSTCIERALGDLPLAGSWGLWQPRIGYDVDWFYARWGNINKGLVYESVKSKNV
jgi:hypothetical protein